MMGIWFVGERPLAAALLPNACALRACSGALAAIPVLPCPARGPRSWCAVCAAPLSVRSCCAVGVRLAGYKCCSCCGSFCVLAHPPLCRHLPVPVLCRQHHPHQPDLHRRLRSQLRGDAHLVKGGCCGAAGCCARGLIVGCSGSSAECHTWLSTLLQPMASGALLALQQHAVPQCLLSRRCSLVFRVCSWRCTACPRCSTSSTASRRHECNAAWLLFCLYFVTRLSSHTPCAGPMPGVVLAAWCQQGFTWQCHQLASFTCRP